MRDLALKVSVGQGASFEEAYPRAWGASVEIETEQGNIFSFAAPEYLEILVDSKRP